MKLFNIVLQNLVILLLVACAQPIQIHDDDYNAALETDTDGDGIVDRLDPNPTNRPNILILMADDLGFNDLAINNDNTYIDTPNMDQIARNGVRFTRHYAAAVCSPRRVPAPAPRRA